MSCPRCGSTSGDPSSRASEVLVSPDLGARVQAGKRIQDLVRTQAVYLGQTVKPIFFSPDAALEWNVPLRRIPVVEGQLHLLLRCVPVCARCFLSLLPLPLRESVGADLLDGGEGAGA